MYTLCLSGGGFRATLFHLGVIRRLIYLDIFKEIERINSVSGGSIAAGMIMKEYTFNGRFNSVEEFDERVIIPIINFIQQSPKKDIYRFIPLQKSTKKFEKASESILQKKSDFIISDASAASDIWGHKRPSKVKKLKRAIDISIDQNSKLRRRLIFGKLYEKRDSILIETSKELSTYTSKIIPTKPSPTEVEKMPEYKTPQFEIEKNIALIRTHLNAFHDLEIQLLLWNGMVKVDAALKRWVPSKVKGEFWNDVPVLKMNDSELKKCVEILAKGKATKIYWESHKKLHFNEELKENISNKL